jgi:deoxyribodipyrimidine photo-lyase
VSTRPSIVWLRDDLRLADNPALCAAVDRGAPIVVVYLLDDESRGIRPLGGATRWWLHHSLAALRESLRAVGGELTLRRGAAIDQLGRLVDETDAGAVFWNRRYGTARSVDAELKSRLRARDIETSSFAANLLFEPWTVLTGSRTPYRVFTPFLRACREQPAPRGPLPAPARLTTISVATDDLADWQLMPTKPDWAGGLAARWAPGEASALRSLDEFATSGLADYHHRDEPGLDSTSHLSPHLRFGELSPFQIWDRLTGSLDAAARKNSDAYLRQLVWREFNWNILFHNPQIATSNLHPEFDAFPWAPPKPAELEAWQQGRTGIRLVDAGMRELWQTGYMHNRVRMVAASFLIKNLLVDWRIGEEWFWDTLVDADEANNPGNWQWVAGSGADAAPYFRVFNPDLQAAKFDPNGTYISRWIPDDELSPSPIVDLAETRRAALDAYEMVKRSAGRPQS